jgi:hypothetical protein
MRDDAHVSDTASSRERHRTGEQELHLVNLKPMGLSFSVYNGSDFEYVVFVREKQ